MTSTGKPFLRKGGGLVLGFLPSRHPLLQRLGASSSFRLLLEDDWGRVSCDLMVSSLDSGSGGADCVVPLFTQVYKWVRRI